MNELMCNVFWIDLYKNIVFFVDILSLSIFVKVYIFEWIFLFILNKILFALWWYSVLPSDFIYRNNNKKYVQKSIDYKLLNF